MKIIQVDLDDMHNSLIAENVSDGYAKSITDFLNEKYSGYASSFFFIYRPDDYKLYAFES